MKNNADVGDPQMTGETDLPTKIYQLQITQATIKIQKYSVIYHKFH